MMKFEQMNYLKLMAGFVATAAEYGVEYYKDGAKKRVFKDTEQAQMLPLEEVDKLLEEVDRNPMMKYINSRRLQADDNLDYRREWSNIENSARRVAEKCPKCAEAPKFVEFWQDLIRAKQGRQVRNMDNFHTWVDTISEVKVVGDEVEVPQKMKAAQEEECVDCENDRVDHLLEEVENTARKSRLSRRDRKHGKEEVEKEEEILIA